MEATASGILQSKISLILLRLAMQAQRDLARSGSSREDDILLKRFPSCLHDACLPQHLRCSRVWLVAIANACGWHRALEAARSTSLTTQNTKLRFDGSQDAGGWTFLKEVVIIDRVQLEEHTALLPVHPKISEQCRVPSSCGDGGCLQHLHLPPEVLDLARAAVRSHLGHALRSSGDAADGKAAGNRNSCYIRLAVLLLSDIHAHRETPEIL